MKKQIIILAKSNKRRHDGTYGKCVAGLTRETNGGYQWVRLVADREGDSLTDEDFPYKPLDVVEAELTPCPLRNHIENYTFANLEKRSSINLSQLKEIFQQMPHSFFGSMTSYYRDGTPPNSLSILLAHDIRIYWEEKHGDKKQRMDFSMGNNRATGISMTDRRHYTDKATSAEKTIPLAICVASLPNEPVYNKFIASIFPIDSI